MVNVVSGQLPPAQGQWWLGEQPIAGLRPDRIAQLGLARTYQVPKAPPELTIREVISVPLTYVRSRVRHERKLDTAEQIAAFCEISLGLETPCSKLSVPDLRRLEIARALACGPSLLLLDEVMAGLMPNEAAQAVELVRRIRRTGVTVVMIEHEMRIINNLCDRVVVLNQGTLLAEGAPREVLSRPEVQEAYLGKDFSL
jgi:branched-chain amino acid transport system ATP-binding protein